MSAVSVGVAEVKEVVRTASTNQSMFGKRTVLFLDEIHRFNKLQQDALLPHVESGLLTLIGATTENPSFALNRALLSRCRLMVLEKLSDDNIRAVVSRALGGAGDPGVGDGDAGGWHSWPGEVRLEERALAALVRLADGDARVALNTLHQALQHAVRRANGDAEIVEEGAGVGGGCRERCAAEGGPAQEGGGGGEESGQASSQADLMGKQGCVVKDALDFVTPARERAVCGGRREPTRCGGGGMDEGAGEDDRDHSEEELQDTDVETPPAAVGRGSGAVPDKSDGRGERAGREGTHEVDGAVSQDCGDSLESSGCGGCAASSRETEGGRDTETERERGKVHAGKCLVVVAEDVRLALQVPSMCMSTY